MSQVSIFTDLVFRGSEAVAEARRIEAEFRGVAQRISATPINVEVRFDDASVSAIAKLRAEADQPIRIPIETVDRVTPLLTAMRAEQAAIPILIPLGLDPGSVAAVTAQIQALVAMGSGAGVAATAGALSAVPTVAAAAALNAPAAAAVPAVQTAAGAATETVATVAATAAELAVAPAAGIEGAAMAGAEGASEVTAATPYATVPYSGVQSEAAAANPLALRSVFRALLVGKVAADTAAAGGRATALGVEDVYHGVTGEGYSTTRLQERQQQIKAGQEDINSIPLLGPFIKSIGENVVRVGSAYMNSVQAATGNARGGKQVTTGLLGGESDIAYGERLTAQTAEQDKHTQQLEREVEIRGRIGQQIESATQRVRDQAALERATGEQRIQLTRQARLQELTVELQDPKYRDARGQLTGQGRAYQQARTGLIEAQYGREFEANAVQSGQFNRTLEAAQLRDAGQTRMAENVEFESQLTAIRQRYVAQGRTREFDVQLEPILRRDFNRDQGLDITRQAQQSGAAVRGEQEAGREADLRTQGREREASLQARNFAIDERVRKLREAAAAETDLTRAAQLRAEAEAAADAGGREKAANNAEFRRQQAASVASLTAERMRAETDATRDSLDTQLALFDEYWRRRIAQTQRGTEHDEAVRTRDAARQALVRRHELETQDIGESAHETELRNQGLTRQAERERIRYDAEKEVREAGNDQARVDAIRRRERAQLRGVDHESVAVFGGNLEFARSMMEEDAQREATGGEVERQPGETLDAFRKRQQSRQPFRQNPITAKWDQRAERGRMMRAEREADAAAIHTTDLGVMVMPGGPLDFSGRVGIAKAEDEGGPFDKRAAADFNAGSKDFREASADFRRILSDPQHQLAVVTY